jgi:hypothetical protein
MGEDTFLEQAQLFCNALCEQFGAGHVPGAVLPSESELFLENRLGQIQADLLSKRSLD